MICENCLVEYNVQYGSGRFCCEKCARSFSSKTNREETNKKVSITLKLKNLKPVNGFKKGFDPRRKVFAPKEKSFKPIKTKNNKIKSGFRKNYSDRDVVEIVETSFSLAEVLRKLNLKPVGGNYISIKRKILLLNIDVSHFTGKLWSKGLKLKANDQYKTKEALRKWLIKERNNQCEVCGISEWMGNKISLELHHIDGNSLNNETSNLQILCPNCHSQTKNFRNQKH